MVRRRSRLVASLLLPVAVGAAAEACVDSSCPAPESETDATAHSVAALLQLPRRRERSPPETYAGDAWHLSDAGRRALAQGSPEKPSVLQSGAARSTLGGGDSRITVYYSSGFFGELPREETTAEQCELPCVRESYPGPDGARDQADLLVSFPMDRRPPTNSRGAPALAHSMEAPGLFGSQFAGAYSGTMNTSLASTVPWPYFGLRNWRKIQDRAKGPEGQEELPGFGGRLPAAAFVARNCGGRTRNRLIEELVRRGVPIHSISDCTPGSTRHAWPEGVPRSDKIAALKRYRVYLAFENVVETGYVTEKAIDGFAGGAVPLYLGAPDVGEYIPKDGYISANAAMESLMSEAAGHEMDALAAKVKAAIEDEATWKSYVAWRDEPLEKVNGGALVRRWAWSDTVVDLCRLCRFAYAQLTPGARWDQRLQQAVGGAPPPARADAAAWAAWRRAAAQGGGGRAK